MSFLLPLHPHPPVPPKPVGSGQLPVVAHRGQAILVLRGLPRWVGKGRGSWWGKPSISVQEIGYEFHQKKHEELHKSESK